MASANVIRYFYESSFWSNNAVKHCFKYISLLTKALFIEDPLHPQIFGSNQRNAPDTAKIIFDVNSSDGDKVNREMNHVGIDLIDFILSRLALKSRKGPFFECNKKYIDSGEHDTISGAIQKLFDALNSSNVLNEQSKTIEIWPENAQFAASLTHDIDIARRTMPGSLRLMFKGRSDGRIRGLVDSTLSAFGLRGNPYDRVKEWIRIESEKKIKSTYFIFAGARLFSNDPKYKLSWIEKSLRALVGAGCEIGLHNSAGGYSGDGVESAADQLRQFGLTCISGIRPHYLSVDLPNYWIASQKAGFEYTSSLGFDDRIGYEYGIDLPIVPFDVESDRSIPIVEIPIAIMDCGLMNEKSRSIEFAVEKGRKLIDDTRKRQGLVVFDWHQRALYEPEFPGWGETLLELIDYCKSKGAVFLKMNEIAQLFREDKKIS